MEGAHETPLKSVDCAGCHEAETKQHAASLHGRAMKRGDSLAPTCASCHGKHDIRAVKDPASPVSPLQVPFTCGKCHQEGTAVMRQRNIHQDQYPRELFGVDPRRGTAAEGAGRHHRGAPSCHTAPTSGPTPTPACPSRASTWPAPAPSATGASRRAPQGDPRRAVGEGGARAAGLRRLPPAAPVRRVFYTQAWPTPTACPAISKRTSRRGTASRCFVDATQHQLPSRQGRLLAVPLGGQRLAAPSLRGDRAEGGLRGVPRRGRRAVRGEHGKLLLAGEKNAPSCKDCHGTHGTLGRLQTDSPTFPTNVPELCGHCHREGEKAAVRYQGTQHEIVEHYTESIHGKGLLKSGLIVTATCADCHTAHGELPRTDPLSSVNRKNVPQTCARCHRGIYEQFEKSIHSRSRCKTDKQLPVCSDCHSAHTIARTDAEDFKLDIMNQCGRCHERDRQDLLRHLSRQGVEARLHEDRQVLRLPRRARHPAGLRPALAPLAREHRRDLPEVPPGLEPPLRRLPDARHAPRPEEVPVAVLHLLGHDRPAGRHLRGRRGCTRCPGCRARCSTGASCHAGRRAASRDQQSCAFPPLYRNLHLMVIVSFIGAGAHRHDAQVLLHRWARLLSRLLGGFEAAGFIHRVCAVITFAYFVIHICDLVRSASADAAARGRVRSSARTACCSDRRDLKEFVGSRSSGSSGAGRGRTTGAGPTGRSSTTSRCSGAWP